MNTNLLDSKFQNAMSQYKMIDVDRVETYSEIINELIDNDYVNEVGEIKYRVTGDEDINRVHLDVLSRVADLNMNLRRLYLALKEYEEEDIYKRFF
jgi:hypothetical protein